MGKHSFFICRLLMRDFINGSRIDQTLGHHLKPLWRLLPEKAASIPLVAGRAGLANLQQDRVRITIDENPLDMLLVAAFFPLSPKLAARPAEIHGSAGRDCFGVA